MEGISIGWWIVGVAFVAFAIYMAASRFLHRRPKSGEDKPQITSTNSLLR